MQNPFAAIAKNMKKPGDSQRAEPIAQTGQTPGVSHRTEIYTYFTTAPLGVSKLLYSSQSWVNVRLTLETAGPVAVSTREDVVPVLGGKGILLVTGREVEFSMPAGNRLFIASTAVNRVSFIVEPIPWLQSITNRVDQVVSGISQSARAIVGAVLQSRKVATTKTDPDEICPPRLRPPRMG